MPPASSGQSLLTFPDILQPGGESYSEPVESDGHQTGLFGDAMKDVRQCARTHMCAYVQGGTTPPVDNEAGETMTMAPNPPPPAGWPTNLSSLKRRRNPTQGDLILHHVEVYRGMSIEIGRVSREALDRSRLHSMVATNTKTLSLPKAAKRGNTPRQDANQYPSSTPTVPHTYNTKF